MQSFTDLPPPAFDFRPWRAARNRTKRNSVFARYAPAAPRP